MKRFVLLACVLVGVVVLVAAGSACAARVKIGVIDIQKIMRDSKAAKETRGMFLMDVESKRALLKEKENEIRAMEKELKEQGDKMSAAAQEEKKDKLVGAFNELRQLKEGIEEELKKKDFELRRKLAGEIREIAEEFSKKKKFTIILERQSVIVPSEAIDITDEIIQIYDEKKK
jgi:outer membrane protein